MSPFQPDDRPPEAAPRPAASPAAPRPPADADPEAGPDPEPDRASDRPRLQQAARGTRLARKAEPGPALTPQQRLLLLDAWRRSGLPAGDFAPLDRVEEGCCHPSPPSEPYVRFSPHTAQASHSRHGYRATGSSPAVSRCPWRSCACRCWWQ